MPDRGGRCPDGSKRKNDRRRDGGLFGIALAAEQQHAHQHRSQHHHQHHGRAQDAGGTAAAGDLAAGRGAPALQGKARRINNGRIQNGR